MKFHGNHEQRLAYLSQPVARALLLLITLSVLTSAALAQGTPPNMDFRDSPGARYRSGGTGVVIQGTMSGHVTGMIRNGALTDFHISINPDVEGPHRLRLLTINYRPGSNVSAPSARWYNLSNGKKLVISQAQAKEYFNGTNVYSIGYADVEITFENGGPGRLLVRYQHGVYSGRTNNQNLRVNGTICNAVPLAGFRLSYVLR